VPLRLYATALGFFVFGDDIKPAVYPGIAPVLRGASLNAWYTGRQKEAQEAT
jgi:hypothetical protein